MTRFGISVSVAVVVLILGIGFFIFGRPTTVTYTNPNPITQNQPPVDQTPSTPPPTVPPAEFDKTVSMNIGDKVTFTDGLNLQVKEINDSRCKLNVQCFWQGELSALLTASSAGPDAPASEFRLGTVNNKSVTLKNYKFTLASATEKSISIVVSKTK